MPKAPNCGHKSTAAVAANTSRTLCVKHLSCYQKKLFKSIHHSITILFIVEIHHNKSNLVILGLGSFPVLPKAPNCGQKSTATWGRYITRIVAPHTPSRSYVPIIEHHLYEKNISKSHINSGPPHILPT